MADNELTNVQNDALTSSILNKHGIDTQLPFSRDIFLMNTMINGAMHVKTIYKQARALNEGDRVTLRLEPKNKYDEKAILVLDPKGKKLGYIPRVKNEVLYHLMDAGKELFGIVKGGDIGEDLDENDTWIEIYIDVYMRD
ncbi:HIRAN domain-containing protein [Butyrivibrio sp. NC2007]|uniref:HIRAN domain-containing protein n=1 Tax=Butyrivibrio sp. NC2007 TaxID=1280683 RepID=UPI0003B500E9|nr:HIRAN domain-containing protein [Butyrivibrio sp. NC2007]